MVGRALGLQFQSVEVRALDEFESAFKTATRTHSQALIVLRNPLIVNNRKRIADLASKSKLPAMYDDREFVDAGGLMSYGADLTDLHRRAAVYVDKILKGAKPADLPVEQPMKFEFDYQSQSSQANRLDDSAGCVGAGGQSHQMILDFCPRDSLPFAGPLFDWGRRE